jgi:hypothetical protein
MTLDHAKQKLEDYSKKHQAPGGFLQAVLANDLIGAVGSADKESLQILPDIAKYVFNNIPSNVWGSPSKVKAHLEKNISPEI